MRLYDRPVVALAAFLGVCAVSAFLCRGFEIGKGAPSKYATYTIRFDYYGMDSAEMDRLITAPLEGTISGMTGLVELRSIAEYGSSVTVCSFEKSTDSRNTYLALREAVDELYSVLPPAVQKPRIYASDSGSRPSMTVSAVSGTIGADALRHYVESAIKPAIEALRGVAEVTVSGGGVEEIRVDFDPGRMFVGGVDPSAIGMVVRDANGPRSAVDLTGESRAEIIAFDARIAGVDELKDLPIAMKDSIAKLSSLASVGRAVRNRNEISRIDERESVFIAVRLCPEGNATGISREIRSILDSDVREDIDYTVLSDDGEMIAGMIRRVLSAIVQSFVLVVALMPFFFSSTKTIGLVVLTIPASALMTFASLNALGFSVDQNVLAGMSIAFGLIVDAPLVIAGIEETKTDRRAFLRDVERIVPSVVSSGITTILAFFPLWFMEGLVPGIRAIAATIAIMVLSSLALSCLFLPCFCGYGDRDRYRGIAPIGIRKAIKKTCARASFMGVATCLSDRRRSAAIYCAVAALPFVAFIAMERDIGMERRDDILSAYAEFGSDWRAESVDRALEPLVRRIRAEPGVRFVWTEAKKGSMEIEIKYDAKARDRDSLARSVSGMSGLATPGYLYVPDLKEEKDEKSTEIEVAVVGDDSDECKRIAREAASAASSCGGFTQSVLNFKEGESILSFVPDRDRIAGNTLTVESVAGTLRWMVFGPVVDKWVRDGIETDIRVSGSGFPEAGIDGVRSLHIPTKSGGVRLESLGAMRAAKSPGKLYRKDGRRAAFFTAHFSCGSDEVAIENLRKGLSGIDLPAGYAFSLPRELERMGREYSTLMVSFFLSVAGILILLTALSENPLESLIIASIIPVSASLPLAIRFVSGMPLGMGDIVGMIVLGGVSVNNAIYVSESGRSRISHRVREKIHPILVTSLTSVAGSLPLAIFGEPGFSRDLAHFMIWGTLCSVFACVFLFPAVSRTRGGR